MRATSGRRLGTNRSAARRRTAFGRSFLAGLSLCGLSLGGLFLSGCTFSVDEPARTTASNPDAPTQGNDTQGKQASSGADAPAAPNSTAQPAPEKPNDKPEQPADEPADEPAKTAAQPPKPASGGEKKSPLLQIESTSRRAVDRASGIESITFDELNLGMQADMVFRDFLLTDRVRELDGKKIRLIGYMDGGVSQTKGLKEFVLLKNTECKFGPGGQADHLVRVLMKGDATADYSLNALQIEGTLKVSPFNGPDGNTWSVYDVEGESVKVIRAK